MKRTRFTLATSAGVLILAFVVLPAGAIASDFTQALTEDYFDIARLQYYYADDKFAVKARAADKGENVLPDDPANLKIPSDSGDELSESRARLMSALDNGFPEQNPKQASLAQTKYDCWLWAVIESNKRCIEKCGKGFHEAVAA